MKRYKLKDLSISKLEYGSGTAACEYDGDTRYVRITDIDSTGNLGDDIVSPNCVDEKYILNDGDVLFARTGATVGKTYRYHEKDGRCLYAGFLIRVIPNQKIIRPDYLYYFTKSPQYNNFVQSSMKVVAQPNINAKQYGDLEFNVPKLEIQDEIIEKLSKITRVIEARKQELVKLDELIKARFVEMFGDPVENPNNLPVVLLGELSELITKGASPSWQGFSYTEDSSQTLFVTSENVREGYIDLSSPKYIEDGFNEKQKRSVIHKGDFLINIVGASIGRAAQFNLECKANMNQAAALVRVNDKRVRDKYLLIYLNSDKAQMMYDSMKSDTGRANLSLQDISNLSILLPAIEQQIDFEKFVEQVDKSKFAVQKALEETQILFDSLMQEYFG